MQKIKIMLAVAVIAMAAQLLAASPTVTAVTAQQRYPWNGKVDIVVMFSGEESDVAAAIAILLCSNKNDSVVKMSLPETNDTILAAEYKLRLPSGEKLLAEIAKVEDEVEQARESKQ